MVLAHCLIQTLSERASVRFRSFLLLLLVQTLRSRSLWRRSSYILYEPMTDTTALPDFIEVAATKYPEVMAEYLALKALFRELLAGREPNDLKHTVLLQSGIAWQHYNAVLLLVSHGFGMQGLVLCRTLFEVVVGTLYLIENPKFLSDFKDHGKLAMYEQCLASGLDAQKFAEIALECKAIKARQGKRKTWHGSKIKNVATAVGLGEIYDLLYKDASSVAHADATKTLSHGSGGWEQSLRSFQSEREANLVRFQSFWLTGNLLIQINKNLNPGHNNQANALSALICEREKAAAMLN